MAPKDLGRRALLILVDTDVLIEMERGSSAAGAWLAANHSANLFVPVFVSIELIIGAQNGVELSRSKRKTDVLRVLWHCEADNSLAFELVSRHRLATGLGLADYLIGAQALNHGAVLYTFNLKHFGAIPGLDARAPYVR